MRDEVVDSLTYQDPQTATALARVQAFDLDLIYIAADVWAAATTAVDTPRRQDLRRDKARMVLAFFAFTERHPAAVTALEVEAWRIALEGRGLAAETVYAYLSRLSSFYTWLRRDPQLARAIPHNPVLLARPKPPKPYQSRRTKALSDDDLRRLLQVVKAAADDGDVVAKRDYALLLFYILTGMRRQEIIQLEWSDLEIAETIVLTTQVKGGTYRTKEIVDPSVKVALLEYLAASGRLGTLAPESPLWIAHDPARDTPPGTCKRNPKKSKVARHVGDPLTSHGFVKNLKRYAAEIGLADIHLHQTRHTFARMVGEDAGSLMEVQEALGHKDIATTRVYLERVSKQKDKHSRQIARRLGLHE
jgi:integrase